MPRQAICCGNIAATCRRSSAFRNNFWGQRKRSIFLYNDKIYTVTKDNFLVALDAKTGKELWEVNRGGDLYATNTSGPIVVNGVVIAGSNCQEAPFRLLCHRQ